MNLPSWDALHPLIIHFPIAFFVVAPVFVILAMALPRKGAGFGYAALILLLLGTAGAFVAVSTGEAAGELVTESRAVEGVLEQHEDLASLTRNVFAGISVLYLAGLAVVAYTGPDRQARMVVVVNAIVLVLLVGGNLLLVSAAHQGGRLVHEFGVRAMMPAGPSAALAPVAFSGLLGRHEDDD